MPFCCCPLNHRCTYTLAGRVLCWCDNKVCRIEENWLIHGLSALCETQVNTVLRVTLEWLVSETENNQTQRALFLQTTASLTWLSNHSVLAMFINRDNMSLCGTLSNQHVNCREREDSLAAGLAMRWKLGRNDSPGACEGLVEQLVTRQMGRPLANCGPLLQTWLGCQVSLYRKEISSSQSLLVVKQE